MASSRTSWVATSFGLAAAIAAVSAVVGFAWLPQTQPGAGFDSLWDAICSAAGLVRAGPVGAEVVEPGHPTTRVEVTPELLGAASADSIGRGATLALRCSMCHGARGLSNAEIPDLAGEPAFAIYKQLADFKTGARQSAVMGPLVAGLGDADMRDLAAYYAYLPRVAATNAAGEPPRIVASGAPMRGVAPCGACHGGIGAKPGAPWLNGQPAAYLRLQLEAFSTGARHNDIGEQMRNVAQAMSREEIAAASRYYADSH
jgi:cytochrome c553